MFHRKKIKEHFMITIPEPCSQDWNKMSVVDREHRHCSSCEKLVVDFTSMSTDEIVLFLHHNKEKTCGRFTATQLGAAYNPLPQGKRTSSWWKAAVLLPLSFFSKNVDAQQNDSLPIIDSLVVRNDSMSIQNDTALVSQDSVVSPDELLSDSAIAHVDSITTGDSIVEIHAPRQKSQSIELVSTGSMVYGGFTPITPIYNGGMTIIPALPMIDVVGSQVKSRRVQGESVSETKPSLVGDPKDRTPDPIPPTIPETPWYEAILPSSLRTRRNG